MGLTDELAQIPKSIHDSYLLNQGSVAQKHLPKDTSFAVVGQVFVIKPSQTKISVLKPDDYTFYIAYIAVVGENVEIISKEKTVATLPIKDVLAKLNDPDMKISELEISMSKEDGLMFGGSTGSAYARGEGLTLTSSDKKLFVKNVVPINPPPPGISSSTVGWYAGFGPLAKELEERGAKVERPSLLATKIIWGLTGLLFLAILIWYIATKIAS